MVGIPDVQVGNLMRLTNTETLVYTQLASIVSTPTHRYGDVEIAQLLIAQTPIDLYVKTHQRPNELGHTPLHLCCEHGKPELVKLLLSFKADITATDSNGPGNNLQEIFPSIWPV